MMMLSVLAKTYYAEKAGIDPKKIFMVAVMPCVAKKFEAAGQSIAWPTARLHRRGAHHTGTDLDDQVLRDQLHGACRRASSMPRWALASGAGDIFGITGGVMEATLRAASELVTGKPADRLEFTEIRGVEGCARPTWPSASTTSTSAWPTG